MAGETVPWLLIDHYRGPRVDHRSFPAFTAWLTLSAVGGTLLALGALVSARPVGVFGLVLIGLAVLWSSRSGCASTPSRDRAASSSVSSGRDGLGGSAPRSPGRPGLATGAADLHDGPMRLALLAAPGVLTALLVVPVPRPSSVTAAAPTCKGRAVTILGTDGPDHLRGTNKRDVILALGGDDRIEGRGGNDVICGGSGRDLIKGGSGADKIFGGADGRSTRRSEDGVRLMVGDVVQGGPGDDLIDLGYDERQQTFGSAQRDRLSYKDSTFRVIVTLGSPKGRGHAQGDGRDRIVSHPFLALLGSDKGDTLIGSTYGDEILGRGGDDHIDGNGGRDVLVDGPRGSRVGDDELVGGVGRDTITSYGGHDRLVGDASADILTVGARAGRSRPSWSAAPARTSSRWRAMLPGSCVKVDGGAGTDELVPTVTQRVRRGRMDADLRAGPFGVRGRARDGCGSARSIERLVLDNAFGSAQRLRWFVDGTDRGEYVPLRHGGSVRAVMHGGRDRVIGSSGDDTLKGGPGSDRLFGGGGKDVAIGGPGHDICRKVEFRKGCEGSRLIARSRTFRRLWLLSPVMPRTRLLALTVCALLAASVVPADAAAGRRAEVWTITPTSTIAVDGHGYGHGRGMSQYGSEGAAQQGLTAAQIMDFYYPGTTMGAKTGQVRVWISADRDNNTIVRRPAGPEGPRPGHQEEDPAARQGRHQVAARRRALAPRRSVSFFKGRWVKWKTLKGDAELSAGGQPMTLVTPHGKVAYRAPWPPGPRSPASRSGVRSTGSRSTATSRAWCRRRPSRPGTPRLWSRRRSRPARTRRSRWPSRCRRSTRSATPPPARSTAASRPSTRRPTPPSTPRRARSGSTPPARPAFTQFSSSNGGWTVAGSQPYLVAQQDPYDGWSGNTNTTWTLPLTAGNVEKNYPAIGTLTSIAIDSRDGNGEWGGRAVAMTLTGTAGSVQTTGEEFRTLVGLKSSLVRPAGHGLTVTESEPATHWVRWGTPQMGIVGSVTVAVDEAALRRRAPQTSERTAQPPGGNQRERCATASSRPRGRNVVAAGDGQAIQDASRPYRLLGCRHDRGLPGPDQVDVREDRPARVDVQVGAVRRVDHPRLRHERRDDARRRDLRTPASTGSSRTSC